MTIQDAFLLYEVVKALEFDPIQVQGNGVVFPNQYADDCLEAWGYNATSKQWATLEALTAPFQGSFSSTPHISMAYSTDARSFKVSNIVDVELTCTLHVADICSDNPEEWILLN